MHRLALLACLSISWALPANAMTVERYLQNKGEPGYDIYMVGLSQGLYWGRTAAAVNGLQMYCPPDNLAITPEQYDSILLRYVESSLVDTSQEEVGMILQFALEEVFPCD